MKIAVRLDDITPDMDWKRFLAVKEILDSLQIKPLIGIVPDNKDENLHICKAAGDFWEYVKNLQDEGWSIALHGFHHIYTTKKGGLFPLNHFSEFAGVSYEKQKQMIEEGTAILKRNGLQTTLFMAPGHSYDKNTLRALLSCGYTGITDGFGKVPYLWEKMTFYPISFKQSKTFKQKNGISTIVLHVNTLTEEEIKRYQQLLTEHKTQMVSYSEMLSMTPQKRYLPGRMREFFMAVIKHRLVEWRSV